MHDSSIKKSTYLGLGALIMWTVEPLLISEINGLPIFELLAIIFLSSFAITAVRITLKKRWAQVLRQPPIVMLIGVIGICASDFAYIFGTQYAPVAHVDLIDYLWPTLAILFTSLLPKEKCTWQHLVGALLGFLGIYFLISPQFQAEHFKVQYWWGYALALTGAILWGGYTAFSRYSKSLPSEMIGIYCGIGGVISLILSAQFETFVMPSATQGSLAILTGITGAGIAYQLWDHGVKHGDVYFLGSMTYLARIAAMVLLVICGKEALTIHLVAAIAFASLGVLVSSLDTATIKQGFDVLFSWMPKLRLPKRSPKPNNPLGQYKPIPTMLVLYRD